MNANAERQRPLSGILNIAKPAGMTSMDVVRRVRRAAGIKRVGNAGTLDPMANGVIPVCLGQATRVVEYLVDGEKEYAAEIRFGASTDTYDALGEITQRRDASHLAAEDVERALTAFEGEIDQIPPMYSALKKDGKPLYELARAGIEVKRDARRVTVHRIALTAWRPPVAAVEIVCGRGFYVRSLAHDLGEALGCGAHLESLTRTRVSAFRLRDSSTLEEVERAFAGDGWREIILGADAALTAMRPMALDEAQTSMVASGRPLPPGAFPDPDDPSERRRAYAADGRFTAIMRYSPDRRWTPHKVFDPDLFPDVPAHNPAIHAHNPDVAGLNPDVAGHNPDVAGHNPDVAGHNPDVAGHNPDVAGHNPDIHGHNPDIHAHNPDIPSLNPVIPAPSPRHSRESGNPDGASP